MTTTRPRFSIVVHFYVWLFFLVLAFLPICVVYARGREIAVPSIYWTTSLIWPAVIAGLFWYAGRRCSSQRLHFQDGLFWITASTMTGWTYWSFFVVLPVLLFVFFSSVLIAVHGDIGRTPGYAQAKWSRLVHYFYRNRMLQ